MSDEYDYDDYDEYDAEDEEDLEALFVMGMLHDEEVRRNKNKGGGCLTTVLTFMMIPMVVILMFSLFGCGKTGQVMDDELNVQIEGELKYGYRF